MESLIEFLNKLTEKGVKFFVEGGRLSFESTDNFISQEVKNEIISREAEIISLANEFPLSGEETRLYNLQKTFAHLGAFNVPICVKLANDFRIDVLNNAWEHLLVQHRILKSRIVEKRGALWRRVSDECKTSIDIQNINFLDDQDRLTFLQEESKQNFDLNVGPLVKAKMYSQDGRDSVLLITINNIIFDEASSVVLLKSLFGLYKQLLSGENIVVRSELFPGQSFNVKAPAEQQSERSDSVAAYWRQQLGGELPGFELLPDVPRLVTASFNGETLVENLPVELAQKVIDFSKSKDVSPSTIFLVTLQLLLHKYTHQEEVIVGVSASS
ncbi:MAG: hypothetical protein EOP48_33865, partial [Sphingobacteriales bacterium]